MKRIVLACDGTWKRADAAHPTNVVKLAQAVLPRARDGAEQVVIYIDGLGVGRGGGRIASAFDHAFGGAFGAGMEEILAEIYRMLVFNHARGDEIFLFGFSRGAFMARSLAGMIRTAGIVERRSLSALPEAMALYRRRGGAHPTDETAEAFRARHSGGRVPDIRYLGVWDTVGALGVPGRLRAVAFANRGLRFHDTSLSGRVCAARHAVAIDERRDSFEPTLWDNLAELNANAEGEPYRQRWFLGDHGSVGGGCAVTSLSDDAAYWVIEGAVEAGLACDPEALAHIAQGRDFRGPLSAAKRDLVMALLLRGRRDRKGPSDAAEIAPSALSRWRADPSYRPGALQRFAEALGLGAEDRAG
jgi:uncharacterized protein (DUF2235 family)